RNSAPRGPDFTCSSGARLNNIGPWLNKKYENISTPVRRISACSGILKKALTNSDCRPSSTDFAVRYRCTWLWSHPKYDRKRNTLAERPDPIVYFCVRSKLKSRG